MDEDDFQSMVGVRPNSIATLNPRQKRFSKYYLDVKSKTFANCYQSAIKAGFSDMTAKNLTHNKPLWLSEIIGENTGAQPEHLLIKLTDIMNRPNETTTNQLKAIDMLMRCKGMYKSSVNLQVNQINIESVI